MQGRALFGTLGNSHLALYVEDGSVHIHYKTAFSKLDVLLIICCHNYLLNYILFLSQAVQCILVVAVNKSLLVRKLDFHCLYTLFGCVGF